jgi:hypothetical protein
MTARYEIKKVGVDKDFIQYTSPSVILGQLSKGDSLIQWGVDLAIKYIMEHGDTYVNSGTTTRPLSYSATSTLLDEARHAWKNKRNSTANIGSELHKLVETYIHLKLDKANIKKQNDFADHIKKQDVHLKNMFYQFIVWSKKRVKRFIESEQTVVNRDKCVAGTLDFIYEDLDGLIYCVDLKTTSFKPYKNKKTNKTTYNINSYYDDHEFQVCAYKDARETMSGEYLVKSMYGGKSMRVDKIKIQGCKILYIERDFFNLIDHDIKDAENRKECFYSLLSLYYLRCARNLNNKRAKERR